MTQNYDVLVVGAGAAGIAAARKLRQKNKKVKLLEARDRVGGRTHTIDFHGSPYDLGAQFLHSASINPMVLIAEGLGMTVARLKMDWNRARIPDRYGEAERREIIGTIDSFFELMEKPPEQDIPVAALLDRLPNQTYRPFIEAIWSWISSREARDCSVRDAQRYNDTYEDWQIPTGYGHLIKTLADGLDVSLSCPVSEIRKTARGVEVESAQGTLRAEKAIVALPSNLLIRGAIRFDPALPTEILETIHSVPMGHAGKLLFRIAKPHPDLGAGARLRVSVTDPGTPSYHVSAFGAPVLMGFFGGESARDLEAAGTDAWADHALSGLKELHGAEVEKHLADPLATGWTADPFSQGGYSAATAGLAHLRPRLAEPFDERLFLAGEHCSVDFYSTVHGAWLTGERAASWACGEGH
jgi:monoamine oxidase